MAWLDVTLRDGGFTTDFRWEVNFASALCRALSMCSADYVELGYVGGIPQAHGASEPGVFADLPLQHIAQLANQLGTSTRCAVMVHPGSLATPVPYHLLKEHGVRLIRMVYHSTWEKQLVDELRRAKSTGLLVSINIALASHIDIDSLCALARRIERYQADILYLADTCGALAPTMVETLIVKVRSAFSGAIGFHAHDALGLALANTLIAKQFGADVVDCSVGGCGRGGGNLATHFWLLKEEPGPTDFPRILPHLALLEDTWKKHQPDCDWWDAASGSLNLTPPQADRVSAMAKHRNMSPLRFLSLEPAHAPIPCGLTRKESLSQRVRTLSAYRPKPKTLHPSPIDARFAKFDTQFQGTIGRLHPDCRRDLVLKIAAEYCVSPEHVLLTFGATQALFLATSCLAENSTTLARPSLVFPGLIQQLRFLKQAHRCYCTDTLALPADARQYHHDLIWLLNYPHNPTGIIPSLADLQSWQHRSSQSRFIFDATYVGLEYNEGISEWLNSTLSKQDAVVVGSITKRLGVRSGPLGYLISTSPRLIKSAMSLQLHTTGLVGPQNFLPWEVIASNFNYRYASMVNEMRKRAASLTAVAKMSGFDVAPPAGGYYVYIKSREANAHKQFASAGIQTVHGGVFGGRCCDTRICINIEDDQFHRLLDQIAILRHESRSNGNNQ